MISERISRLRDWMQCRQLSAFIIPSADPHLGEYIAPVWKSREWISGFTGSAGTVVVTLDKACLWTDSRYSIQAASQLEGTGIELCKSYQNELTTEIPQWLKEELPDGSQIGMNGSVFTIHQAHAIREALKEKQISVCFHEDPFQEIWTDRPSFPQDPFWVYGDEYTGYSASSKLKALRKELAETGADTFLVTPLDEIAWVLNIRGTDVDYNPLVVSYLLVGAEQTVFFVDPVKCTQESISYLHAQGVTVRPYEDLPQVLAQLKDCTILLPPSKTTFASLQAIDSEKCRILSWNSPLTRMKCFRTKIEQEGLRNCMVRDGIAMVRFQRWLWKKIQHGEKVTEMSLAKKLLDFRARQPLFQGESFGTIAGYAAHAASPHYSATPETDTELSPRGLLLVDSGGHYLDGTTDITRTFVLGPLTPEEKLDYTCVLKAHINLASAVFPKGTNGTQLDVLAHAPIWKYGAHYLHGTGHGVGYFLNVHEGTDLYQIRMSYMPQPLLPDTTLTNEPAIYKKEKHGIRIENQMLIKKHPFPFSEEEFYAFETLTLCPIDTEPILISLLTKDEMEWLNQYHTHVYESLSPHLPSQEKEWLSHRCAPLREV